MTPAISQRKMTKHYVLRRVKAVGDNNIKHTSAPRICSVLCSARRADFNGVWREEKRPFMAGLLSSLWSKQKRLSNVLMIPAQNGKP